MACLLRRLYLGLPCLLLVDHEYDCRFWTLFEGWCSAQEANEEEKCLRPADKFPRRTILPVRTTSKLDEYCRKDVFAVRKALGGKDVRVTNQGDKVVQLAKISHLDRRVKDRLGHDGKIPNKHLSATAGGRQAGVAEEAAIKAAAIRKSNA